MRSFSLLLAALLLGGCQWRGDSGDLQVGQKAPVLATKTLADVGGDLSKITTYRYPDPRMYQYSLDAALKTGKPIVLAFATPAHCTVCDNQLAMLKGLQDKYGNQVIFLHMDEYDNPQAYKAFKVVGDPWTFVIGRKGVVRCVAMGRVLYSELDTAIRDVLVGKSDNAL
ncbi:MAG: TlpA family protein disulfide reductase [Burkholderiales bacterium]